jgi:hypothetical protein
VAAAVDEHLKYLNLVGQLQSVEKKQHLRAEHQELKLVEQYQQRDQPGQ